MHTTNGLLATVNVACCDLIISDFFWQTCARWVAESPESAVIEVWLCP
jgi:hypothetical protein